MIRFLGVLCALFAGAWASPCENGWRYSPSSHACYKLIDERLPWVISEFKCLFQGAHHVSIKDFEENLFVAEFARKAGLIWLGAAQFGPSGEYEWPDHAVFDYENWVNGVRPSFNRGKRCSKMDGTGYWQQSCCKVPAAIVCKKAASGSREEAIEEFRHKLRL